MTSGEHKHERRQPKAEFLGQASLRAAGHHSHGRPVSKFRSASQNMEKYMLMRTSGQERANVHDCGGWNKNCGQKISRCFFVNPNKKQSHPRWSLSWNRNKAEHCSPLCVEVMRWALASIQTWKISFGEQGRYLIQSSTSQAPICKDNSKTLAECQANIEASICCLTIPGKRKNSKVYVIKTTKPNDFWIFYVILRCFRSISLLFARACYQLLSKRSTFQNNNTAKEHLFDFKCLLVGMDLRRVEHCNCHVGILCHLHVVAGILANHGHCRFGNWGDAELWDNLFLHQVPFLDNHAEWLARLAHNHSGFFTLKPNPNLGYLRCPLVLPEARSFSQTINGPMHSPAKTLRNQI